MASASELRCTLCVLMSRPHQQQSDGKCYKVEEHIYYSILAAHTRRKPFADAI